MSVHSLLKSKIIIERKKILEEIYKCDISLDKIKKGCYDEVIKPPNNNNVHERICYIILIAMKLNLDVDQFMNSNKDGSDLKYKILSIPIIPKLL